MPATPSSDSGNKLIPPNANFAGKAHCPSLATYEEMYKRSIEDPDGFWAEIAETFVWQKKWDKVRTTASKATSTSSGSSTARRTSRSMPWIGTWRSAAIRWPSSGKATRRTSSKKLTYKQLHAEVCKFANVLKSLGVKKGDRVCLYMQMIPELPIAMLACARIGAIHSVVFGAFSEDSLRDRIQDSECKILITQDTALARQQERHRDEDEGRHGRGRSARASRSVVVVKRTGLDVPMQAGRDVWWHEAMDKADAHVRAGVAGRRRSAVHPLHLRLDRQAEGRAAHDRRVHGLRGHDVQVHLRLPGWRHLVVHGRHRLDHRALVHRVRPAVHRRHQRHV